jgi:UDP-N-acetylmuramoyl-tripeptide--D-alanyl-D-alanine ligase
MKRTLGALAAACGGALHGSDAEFAEVLIDSRRVGARDLFCALPGTRVDGHDFVAAAASAGAAGALVARPLPAPIAQVVVADVASALARAAAAWRMAFTGAVIGVAGSNGKTTTKEMLAAILARRGECLATRGNLNNELGVPLTLLRLAATQAAAVIEIGANRAGDVAALAALARPAIGLVTNAGAEHLEGFGSLDGVARAEGEMVAALAADGVAVINHDDPYAGLWRSMTRARVLAFGLGVGADIRATDETLAATAAGFRTRFTLHSTGAAGVAAGTVAVSLALAGRHNVHNALAAAAAALAAGATLAQVAEGLASVRAVEGRLQLKAGAQGAWLIDDSYNANPSSLRAALDVLAGLAGRRWLVLGDMAELGEHAEASHREAGALARASGVQRLYTFGPQARLAGAAFGAGAGHASDLAALGDLLRPQLAADVRLLIKGSRVNRLERLVSALAAGASAAAPQARPMPGQDS